MGVSKPAMVINGLWLVNIVFTGYRCVITSYFPIKWCGSVGFLCRKREEIFNANSTLGVGVFTHQSSLKTLRSNMLQPRHDQFCHNDSPCLQNVILQLATGDVEGLFKSTGSCFLHIDPKLCHLLETWELGSGVCHPPLVQLHFLHVPRP